MKSPSQLLKDFTWKSAGQWCKKAAVRSGIFLLYAAGWHRDFRRGVVSWKSCHARAAVGIAPANAAPKTKEQESLAAAGIYEQRPYAREHSGRAT
jgi:hypothetical protein